MQLSAVQTAAILAASSYVSAADNREAAMVSMEVYMNDIGSHMKEYMSMEKANPKQSIPPGVLSAYAAKMTAKGDSYTSFFSDIPDSYIQYMITGVPWYSSRLVPALSSALKAKGLKFNNPYDGSNSSNSTNGSNSTNSSLYKNGTRYGYFNSTNGSNITNSTYLNGTNSTRSNRTNGTNSTNSTNSTRKHKQNKKASTSSKDSSSSNAGNSAMVGAGAAALAAVAYLL